MTIELCTIGYAARALEVDQSTVRRLVDSGQLKMIPIRGSKDRFFDVVDLGKLKAERAKAAKAVRR